MKNLFYLFMLMAVAVMPLTSCEKDNQAEYDPKSDADKIEVTTYDALSWLQGGLVVVNKNGEIIRRVYGEALDASQPDVISVPVADYAAAENIFLSWVAPTKEATNVDGGYDYNLTDKEGKAQGSVSFRAVDSDAGVLARMTVNEGTDLMHISEVNFIDHSLWPENDATPKYVAGKTYVMDGYDLTWEYKSDSRGGRSVLKDLKLEPLLFYCIQGNTDGKEGILVWLCPDVGDKYKHPGPSAYVNSEAYQYLPTEVEAQKVLDFYNNNYEFWENMIVEMEGMGYEWDWHYGWSTTGNEEFIFNAYDSESDVIKCLDFDDEVGKIEGVKLGTTLHNYRYMHIRTIPAVD